MCELRGPPDLVGVQSADGPVEREGDAAGREDARRRLHHVEGRTVRVEERQRPAAKTAMRRGHDSDGMKEH